jgi:membrane-associated phospholipid phosphatase
MHFVTDVAAGAMLGSAIGYLVPFIHRQRFAVASGLSLETSGKDLMVRYRF